MSINKMLDQIDKLWDMHAIECYKSMKKNEVALYKLIQKNLQAIQLNGINNVQNSVNSMLHLYKKCGGRLGENIYENIYACVYIEYFWKVITSVVEKFSA